MFLFPAISIFEPGQSESKQGAKIGRLRGL